LINYLQRQIKDKEFTFRTEWT